MTATSAREASTADSPPRWRAGSRIGATSGGSLFRKYVVYFVALVSAALIVSGLVGLYFTYEESKTARLNLQHEKAEAAAYRIETYLREIENQIGWLHLAQITSTNVEQLEARRLLRIECLKLLGQVNAIMDVAVFDSSGRERVRESRHRAYVGTPTDFSSMPALVGARSGKTYFSAVDFRNNTEPYLTIAVAGLDKREVIAVEVNLTFVWEVIRRIKIGSEGFAYLVDSHGFLIAHPNISQVLRKTDLSDLPHVRAALARKAGEDAERVTLTRNLAEQEVLVAYAPVASLGWNVFVEQPLTDVLAPLKASLARTGLLLLAGLLLAVAVSLFLARHMVTPIRVIQAGAARIAAGNLDQRIAVRTGDELEALGTEFNNMAYQLRESYAGLERKVDERTRELRDTLEQQTATAEVLHVISSSPTDMRPVLEGVAQNAGRLCDAHEVVIYLVEGDTIRPTGANNRSTSADALSDGSIVGRAILQRRTLHVDDAGAGQRGGAPDLGSAVGYRTVLAVPFVRENAALGAIVVRRRDVNPFSDRHIRLLEMFAAQIVIAIENVRMFKEIEQKNRELELADRHKSEFLANVSHELRTPLNAIIGFSEVLRERMFGEINDKQAEYLEDIHSSGKHLLSLINDILNLAKIEAGRMDLELSRFDICDAIQDALGFVRERASRRGIELALTQGSGVDDWVADARKFKQIMLNLLSNAVKFTPDAGRITVRAAKVADWLEVSVTDTGVGIAPQHLDVIFDEFRQLTSDSARREDGTGLGLPLTRRFVELHGGTLRVHSTLGEGSTFTFTLPEKTVGVA